LSAEHEEQYVRARRVLLDALEALGGHRSSVILVGAQAIYVHAGEATFGMAPYTTDADLAIDPRLLEKTPPIELAMESAGFRHGVQPGIWLGTDDIQVDLLVPEGVGGSGRRGARLEGHGKMTARKVAGLEGALVENEVVSIGSLRAADDGRQFDIRVAGPSALLVAKLYKLWERRDAPRRLENKDAADVFRLLQTIETERLVAGLGRLGDDPISRLAAITSLEFLEGLFAQVEALGIRLLRAAVAGLDDPEIAAASCVELANDLLRSAKRER
jgi:nucleotidyltransferase-like protein